ncbi:hypothetical protein CC1G_04491 [Coprinopsis cinerea okayama7|uniref:Transmembrane protein n=1 Tax=Coprinopsis cinerea (strain Okayama-7 / 130 / ATCC MYA-4618 / FGSC 9003) TaxID=240176 RepID=A8N5B3_COPC7|nr:hypothetical protein CC1G_04491 [Coprinopsis cinerea okayama7\|eukprot:XP_001830058.1 hypothetical protein CC1G_04491 [Coprinopsis cinerea okayama7\
MRNVTVDDSDRGRLQYSPTLCDGSGWVVESGTGYSGSYSWCTGSSSSSQPTVTLSFTGVAVYYSTPRIEGQSIRVELDGSSSDDINLSIPSGGAGTSIVWYQTGLENTEHTLRLIPGSGSSTLNVDAFIYTALEEDEELRSHPSITLQREPHPHRPFIHSLERRDAHASTSPLPTILGSIVGGIALLIFLWIAYFLHRKAKQRSAQYSWKAPVPPLSRTPDPQEHFDRYASQQTNQSPPAIHRDYVQSDNYAPQPRRHQGRLSFSNQQSEGRVELSPPKPSNIRPLPQIPSRNNSRGTEDEYFERVASPATAYSGGRDVQRSQGYHGYGGRRMYE